MDEVGTNVASGDDTGFWKRSLHFLQESAPKPRQVPCLDHVKWKPNYYGCEYHGPISRVETEKLLLEFGEGAFLVRESQRSFNAFTLSMNFDNNVLNYKLFYDDLCCKHYVGEKRFDSIFELVQDGLICMYVEKHASEYIAKMAESAESIFNLRFIYRWKEFIVPNASSVPQLANFHLQNTNLLRFLQEFSLGIVPVHITIVCRVQNMRMFGVDLASFSLAHRVDVPPVVVQCVSEVERRGLAVEGIYRVSGSHDRMDRLRQQFDLNQRQLDPDLKDEDIHDVAGLLKLYLRLLPLQLVPFTTYKSLLDNFLGISDNGERIRMSRSILTTGLSPFHLPTLGLILKHLRKVSTHCSENKMTAENLSMIFSPTIFCTGKGFPAVPNQQHLLLHFLIVNKSIVSSRYTGSSSSSPF
uniref:SH2 domain-containing protein n=1 Tax=Globodera pallida TaxID=36090 RepID=A0A183C8X9_GLOPA